MKIFFVVSLLLPISLSLAANAPAHQGASSLKLLESRYGAAHTLQVNFLERYTQNGKFVRSESGVAYFLRPGKMRWDYEAPEKNIFLMDGSYTWFYSPADRTATRVPVKQSDDWRTPLAFLTSHMKLSRLCASIKIAQTAAPLDSQDLLFRCELREQPSPAPGDAAASVLFEVTPAGELRRIVAPQDGGIELEFTFNGWKWDPALDKSLFQFNAPRGVVIVNGLLPDAVGIRQ
jgi:outer membrane lipoprotein-sorting protein